MNSSRDGMGDGDPVIIIPILFVFHCKAKEVGKFAG